MTITHPACNEVIHPLAEFPCQSTLQQQETSSLLLYDWSIALRFRPLVQSLRFVNAGVAVARVLYLLCFSSAGDRAVSIGVLFNH